MKYILCQPTQSRFKWELEVALTNYLKVGISLKDVILLFAGDDPSFEQYFVSKFGVESHTYPDNRDDKGYIPSVRPYLWWQYLKEDPKRETERYFYLDSDVIFREKVNFKKARAKDDVWLGSDTNSYLNLDYIRGCRDGNRVLNEMARIVGVTVQSLETINHNSVGAHWIISRPTAAYWEKVYRDSNSLYFFLAHSGSNIQKWTAEMWSQLWNMMYFNIGPKVSDELSFSWATDDISNWQSNKIYHNAGVTESMSGLFFKGAYLDKTPFFDDFSFVDETKCSSIYVQAIMEAKDNGNFNED